MNIIVHHRSQPLDRIDTSIRPDRVQLLHRIVSNPPRKIVAIRLEIKTQAVATKHRVQHRNRRIAKSYNKMRTNIDQLALKPPTLLGGQAEECLQINAVKTRGGNQLEYI